MEEMKCATCYWWTGLDEIDVAECKCPIPIWAERLLEAEDLDDNGDMAGDIEDCPCWKSGDE